MNEKIQDFWRSNSRDYERLLQICRDGLATSSAADREAVLHNETMALYMLERYEEAITRCKEIIPTLSNEVNAFNIKNTLQTCLYKRGVELAKDGIETEKTFAYFKEALQLDPEDELVHYCIGQHYQNQGDDLRAMHHYMEALKIEPNFPEIYNNLGVINFVEESDIKAAIKNMEKALELNPSQDLLTKLYINLIRLHKQIADYDKQDYYQVKLLQLLGFPAELEGDEDDNEEA